ncbi:MAG: tetratricopeptide repeat protein [Cyanobacteria bacterium SIG30]|nr:tetratricopeptide repeat protein [Cyanobacteria bacterium SIG30]
MKRILALLTVLIIASFAPSFATDKIRVSKEVYEGIKKYKQGNYASCIQDMEKAMSIMEDDSIPLYYMANSYVQLGRPEDAKSTYQKVVALATNKGLVQISTKAIEYLNDIENLEKSDDMREFIESRKFLHNEVIRNLESQEIENIQREINSKSNKEDKIDFNKYKYINDASQNNMPTDEEIANAVRVLARVGYNPYVQNGFNSDYLTFNAMGENKSSFANIFPYMMTQNNQNPYTNQQLMQTMMLKSMTSGF